MEVRYDKANSEKGIKMFPILNAESYCRFTKKLAILLVYATFLYKLTKSAK